MAALLQKPLSLLPHQLAMIVIAMLSGAFYAAGAAGVDSNADKLQSAPALSTVSDSQPEISNDSVQRGRQLRTAIDKKFKRVV